MLEIQKGTRGGIVAGGPTPERREHVFLTAVSGVREPGVPQIGKMHAMGAIISAGKNKYVNLPYKKNVPEKLFQVCVNQRAAIQSGQHFVQTASLAITVLHKIPHKHLLFTQCLNRGTLYWSCCHGNRLEVQQQVPVPLNCWMHGNFF